MGLRTADEYRESIQDDREVFYKGERVESLVDHPALSISVDHAAVEFEAQHENPDLFTVERGEEQFSRYFDELGDGDALRRRRKHIEASTRAADGVFNIIKPIGSDAINTLLRITPDIDEKHGTNYTDRVKQYRERARDEDLALATAMTDVKGDRSLGPGEQPDPDYFLNVVEEREDGIVVRGAKAHTTLGPVANEVLVLPTIGMRENEAEYAVAFSIPADADGLKFVTRPTWDRTRPDGDYPLSNEQDEIESMTIFDDVFVPNERVYLNGETSFVNDIVHTFATYHRFTAVAYKPPLVDLFIGAAELIADANGLQGQSIIREKITDMVDYVEMTRGMAKAATVDYELHNGVALPDPMYCNLGKYYFASQYHEMERNLQDIAGGLATTLPSTLDLENEEVGDLVEKYVGANEEWDNRDRFKLLAFIRDLSASEFADWQEVTSIHGEGSLQAQRIPTYQLFDKEDAKEQVKQIADIDGDY